MQSLSILRARAHVAAAAGDAFRTAQAALISCQRFLSRQFQVPRCPTGPYMYTGI